MKDELREVEYTLESSYDLGLMDYPDENGLSQEEATKIRKGLFHRWADEVQIVNGEYYTTTFGIVEDNESHKVYHIVPKRIIFLNK